MVLNKGLGFLTKPGIYFYNDQTPRLIIKTGIYSEEAFIQGNTVVIN